VSAWSVNGAATHCLQLTRELARRGHALTLVCRPDSWIGAQHLGDGTTVERSDQHRWPPDEIRRMARLLRDRDVDVIHTHASRAHFFGVLLRAATGIPVVATAHAHRLQGHWAFNNHVIALSTAGARFQRWNLVPASRVSLVHQFVDTAVFSPPDEARRRDARAALALRDSALAVGYVGSIFREKGLQDLVAAWPAVAAAIEEAQLVIAGDGPPAFLHELRAAIAAQPLPHRVDWLGRRGDIPLVMCALDVLVVPSHDESASIVGIEAMAAGLPVVATRVGGIPEYVADGVAGVLIDRGDRSALSEALIRLLCESRRRAEYGRQGRARALEQFSLPVQVAKIEAILARASTRRS